MHLRKLSNKNQGTKVISDEDHRTYTGVAPGLTHVAESGTEIALTPVCAQDSSDLKSYFTQSMRTYSSINVDSDLAAALKTGAARFNDENALTGQNCGPSLSMGNLFPTH